MCGPSRGNVTKNCGTKVSETMRDCPGYMHLNRHSIVRAPSELKCKIVRAIGQMRVHYVQMQKTNEALVTTLDNSHARHDVVYPLFSFLKCNVLPMYITD